MGKRWARPAQVGVRRAGAGLKTGVGCKIAWPRSRPSAHCARGMRTPGSSDRLSLLVTSKKSDRLHLERQLTSLFGFIGSQDQGPNPGWGSRKAPREPQPH